MVTILVAYLVKTERRELLPADLGRRRPRGPVSLAFGAALTYGPARPDLRGPGDDRRRAVDRRRRLRDLDDLLDGARRPLAQRRAARPDRQGRRGRALVARRRRRAGRRPRGARDRAVPVGRHPGRHPRGGRLGHPDLGAAARRRPRPAHRRRHRRRRSTTAPSRSTSPSSSPIPAASSSSSPPACSPTASTTCRRPASCPGLNNLAFDVSDTIDPSGLLGSAAQGRLQLLAGHHLARGRRLAALRRAGDDPVRARRTPPQQPPGRVPAPPRLADPPSSDDRPTRRTLRAQDPHRHRPAAGDAGPGRLHRQRHRRRRRAATTAPSPSPPPTTRARSPAPRPRRVR